MKHSKAVGAGAALSLFSILLILSPIGLVTRQLTVNCLINSLGMRFVRVAGTRVLFSVWDTRVGDFETFVNNTGHDATAGMLSLGKDGNWEPDGKTWQQPGFVQGPTHPVVGVSWNDAKAFCNWLTKHERSAGHLPDGLEYRLPTDEEWSAAVGLQNEEGRTPEEKSRRIGLFPWDFPNKREPHWPPPEGAGNYAGQEEKKSGDWPTTWSVIDGYTDAYPRTSPVGSFSANQFGLYDMGATCGSGVRIGTMLKSNSVCCAVRRGATPSPNQCKLRIASSAPLIDESMMPAFVVLWLFQTRSTARRFPTYRRLSRRTRVTLNEIRRVASCCASRESLILVQFSGRTKRGDRCTLIGDFVRACAVSHLDAKYWEPTRRTKTPVHNSASGADPTGSVWGLNRSTHS
jgi:hypothetical protein